MNLKHMGWCAGLLAMAAPSAALAQSDTSQNEPEAIEWVMPVGLALFSNVSFWAVGRYVLDAPYSRIGVDSMKRNVTEGFEWDVDAFSTNQLGHPYQGGLYFNGARAYGHSFWVSSAYALFGSLQWELFMENELPSYNDVVTTTFGGMALGEVLFRLSSSVLDDSSEGWERAGREIASGVLAPTHGLARVFQGQVVADGSPPTVPPIRASVLLGPDRILQGATEFELRSLRAEANVIYGDGRDPDFDPYDWFALSVSLNFSELQVQRGEIDIMGILARTSIDCGESRCLFGLNQHYSFMDTPIFQAGASSLGGSFLGQFQLWDGLSLFAHAHLNYVALGGLNALYPSEIDGIDQYALGLGGMFRVGAFLRYQTQRKNWFRDAEFRLQDTRMVIRTMRGLPSTDLAGINTTRIRLGVYNGFGLVVGSDGYHRLSIPDDLDRVQKAYTTEQYFLVWSYP